LDRSYKKTNEAEIAILYQKEPHCGQMAFENIQQPETMEERIALAKRMKEEYELPMPILADTMADQSRELLSDLPSPVFIIDAAGTIQAKLPWPETRLIQDAVDQINATGKWVVPQPEKPQEDKQLIENLAEENSSA
jgi:hypothetical protein